MSGSPGGGVIQALEKPGGKVEVLASESGRLNGTDSDPSWPAPKVSLKSNQKARADLPGRITKTEYRDTEEVFKAKVKLLAKWIKQASNQVIYAGAGMSTAAGINDVASSTRKVESGNRLLMQPTVAHHIVTAMYHKGYIKHVCHQNHDGLCQKAGLPMSALNEIHGSWFDKHNIVKMMDDKLNPKNLAMLHEWEAKSDIVIAVGTSLAGMNADQIAELAGQNPNKKLVIINN